MREAREPHTREKNLAPLPSLTIRFQPRPVLLART